MNDSSHPQDLLTLEARINALLPPRYIGCFEDVSPKSMGSAKLRYDSQGKVVWGEIWTTFCHLALAGGPPHRGRLLGPVAVEEIQRSPEQYENVIAELKRALGLCVDLPLLPDAPLGWICLQCDSAATAVWLVRAIVAENVIARNEGASLYLPAGPEFRLEKEIKNVVVCVAKTCHYLFDHLDPELQPTAAAPLLIRPPLPHELHALGERYQQAVSTLIENIQAVTGRNTWPGEAPGWVGIACGDEEMAVWLLRAVAVEDILVRREDTALYVPVDHRADDEAIAKTTAAVEQAFRLSHLRMT
jgi:sirohydrochlorin cobaltochelatase